MSSKEHILSLIRRQAVPSAALPDLGGVGIIYDDPHAQFAEMAKFVGGQSVRVPDMAALTQHLAELPIYRQAQRIFSSVPEAAAGNVVLESLDDAKQLNGLDLAILRGEFAVAENGAVWVDCDALYHRAVHVAAEHLVLVVPAVNLVHNMHQAYERLSFTGPSYRLFISGPSKTADIEQALVIGAQGPRSLVVYLVG